MNLSHYLKWSQLACIFGVFSALLPKGTNMNKTVSVLIQIYPYHLNAGGGGQKDGLECFVSAQMLMSWCTCTLIFFLITFVVQNRIERPHSTYHVIDFHTNLIPDHKFIWFRLQCWFHLGWFRFQFLFQGLPNSMITIPIPIPIPVTIDSNSDSDSSVSLRNWFRFWFRSSTMWFWLQLGFQKFGYRFQVWFWNLFTIPDSFTTLMRTPNPKWTWTWKTKWVCRKTSQCYFGFRQMLLATVHIDICKRTCCKVKVCLVCYRYD